MKNYYLKTTDETALYTALESVGLAEKIYDPNDENNQRPVDLAEDAEWSPTGAFEWFVKDCSLDKIGTIYTETGNMLTAEDGIEYPETTALEGYHANLLANVTDEQLQSLPTIEAPSSPHRVWAGLEY